MVKISYTVFIFFICVQSISEPVFSENAYDKYFSNEKGTQSSGYHDSLFERVLWHKKVSHIVIETQKDSYWVTLHIHPESPYNFKTKTYNLYYRFNTYEEAFKKFIWIDKFLKNKGILKVKISGGRILAETIIQE